MRRKDSKLTNAQYESLNFFIEVVKILWRNWL